MGSAVLSVGNSPRNRWVSSIHASLAFLGKVNARPFSYGITKPTQDGELLFRDRAS